MEIIPIPTAAVAPTSKGMLWTGRVLSALPILLMGVTGVMALIKPEMMVDGMKEMGYPESLGRTIVLIELGCVVLYAIPQTAVLGAILLTGYLGGATATHVRAGQSSWFMPVLVGVIVWLGLVFRDARLREILPLRRIK